MNRTAYKLKAGSIKKLKLVSEKLQLPGDKEVTIAIKSIGLNFADIFAIQGLYSATPKQAFIPGLEFSGEILKCGKSVEGFKTGDRVMGVTRFGAFTDHINIDFNYITKLPEHWSYHEGASYLVQVITAYYALINLGNLQDGNTVLIHSAAGGVGLWANRIAKKYHAYTIGTVGISSKIDLLKDEGYDRQLVRGAEFGQKLDECLNGRKLNLVLECIGGKIFSESYQRLAPMGRIIVYGSARYSSSSDRPNYPKLIIKYLKRPKVDPQKMIEENKAVMGFNLIWLFHEVTLMKNILSAISVLDLGKPLANHVFHFKNLPDALRLFQSGNTTGKVVVEVNP